LIDNNNYNKIEASQSVHQPILLSRSSKERMSQIDENIHKEEQETKLLRLKYEQILDNLDQRIDNLDSNS